MIPFNQKLRAIQRARQSVLCVGLDPEWERLPTVSGSSPVRAAPVIAFNQAIIEATAPFACAYKLNLGFYEALGPACFESIASTLECIPSDMITIADGKRGDIGNTARLYAKSVFETLPFDACTVAPYMGYDAVAPFLQYPEKAAFVLARTSNPSGAALQQLETQHMHDEPIPLYQRVARHVQSWQRDLPGTAGLVVGGTTPKALKALRASYPDLPFLIPGIGAQGGQVEDIAPAASGPVLVNSSRSIIYASAEDDFAVRAAESACRTRDLLASFIPQ